MSTVDFVFSDTVNASTSSESIGFIFPYGTEYTDTVIDSLTASDTITSKNNASIVLEDQAVVDESYTLTLNASDGVDVIYIQDQFIYAAIKVNTLASKAIAKDKAIATNVAKITIGDVATTVDGDYFALKTVLNDTAITASEVASSSGANVLLKDVLKATDLYWSGTYDEWSDQITASDITKGKLRSAVTLIDTPVIADELVEQVIFSNKIVDKVVIADQSNGSLTASQLPIDYVFVDDEILYQEATGLAWTANTDSWAMSRYEDYQFNEIAVINGAIYGTSESGVYCIDTDTEVKAKITTGKLDLGHGALIHPTAAYLEYELSGQLSITVSSTQSGNQQSYTYVLPTENAAQMTNGRVVFGRGLRGRHFSFEMNIVGTHGYFNDLSVDISTTKRRV